MRTRNDNSLPVLIGPGLSDWGPGNFQSFGEDLHAHVAVSTTRQPTSLPRNRLLRKRSSKPEGCALNGRGGDRRGGGWAGAEHETALLYSGHAFNVLLRRPPAWPDSLDIRHS